MADVTLGETGTFNSCVHPRGDLVDKSHCLFHKDKSDSQVAKTKIKKQKTHKAYFAAVITIIGGCDYWFSPHASAF